MVFIALDWSTPRIRGHEVNILQASGDTLLQWLGWGWAQKMVVERRRASYRPPGKVKHQALRLWRPQTWSHHPLWCKSRPFTRGFLNTGSDSVEIKPHALLPHFSIGICSFPSHSYVQGYAAGHLLGPQVHRPEGLWNKWGTSPFQRMWNYLGLVG